MDGETTLEEMGFGAVGFVLARECIFARSAILDVLEDVAI